MSDLTSIIKPKSDDIRLELSCCSRYEPPFDPNWEFTRDKLSLGKTLGEGEFGKVLRGEANGILFEDVITPVAVKTLKEKHTIYEIMDLVSEMEFMKMIGKHENIIRFLGCCTQDGPLFMIMEYAHHDNLRNYLRRHRSCFGKKSPIGLITKQSLTQKSLVSFAHQVSKGMSYLSSKKCVHRDLAARNVLVNENFTIKITDFGMAKVIENQESYKETVNIKLPLKWSAPEALFHGVFTTQSDVWSYGVLLWEIMTLGSNPYPLISKKEELFDLLVNGYRMKKPPCCSLDIYMIMQYCWSYQPNERPTFENLIENLNQIILSDVQLEHRDLWLPQKLNM